MGKEHDIINTPHTRVPEFTRFSVTEACREVEDEKFAFCETQGKRDTQEDAVFRLADLQSEENLKTLQLKEIAQRIWSSFKQLDSELPAGIKSSCGSTVNANYYDGKGNLLTATLGDSHSFAVIYGKEDTVLRVVRLNTVTHKPTRAQENKRILAAGGEINFYKGCWRVNKRLAVTRSLGDRAQKLKGKSGQKLILADVQLEHTTIDQLTRNIQPTEIETIEILSTCDGFTDAAADQTKEGHEAYLFNQLSTGAAKGLHSLLLCRKLVYEAERLGSRDNISVAVQTIFEKGQSWDRPLLFGVFDGHGGDPVASQAASTIGSVFRAQCAMTQEEYEPSAYSIYNDLDDFTRDNARFVTPQIVSAPKPSPR